MFTIENHLVKAVIHPKGAELQSLLQKESGIEYMWKGDPAVWGKFSPVLFPIVGTLKDNTYFYQDQSYHLSRHGFARDHQFAVESQDFDKIVFHLKSSEETLKLFPFKFEFRIAYTIVESCIAVSYEVLNTGEENMYFSVGGHPAFAVPLVPGTEYSDYYLEFDQPETTGRWPISEAGLIKSTPVPLLHDSRQLPLNKSLFAEDALVLKKLKSSRISLLSRKTEHGLSMDFPGFPYLGLWAAPGADFLCIEPWCGIADSVDALQLWEEKEGINKLEGGGRFVRTWTVKLF